MTSIFGERLWSHGHSIRGHRNLLAPNISEPSLDLIGRNPDPDPFGILFPRAPSSVCPCPFIINQTPTNLLKTSSFVSQRDRSYHSNVRLIDQTTFSLRLHSAPLTSHFETFHAQSHANSSKVLLFTANGSRKPGEVTDQSSTLRLFLRHPGRDESSK